MNSGNISNAQHWNINVLRDDFQKRQNIFIPGLEAGFAAVFDGDPGASPGLEAEPTPGAARVLEAAVGRGGRGIPPCALVDPAEPTHKD